MAHWETATRALHRHGGGPLTRSKFDSDFETDRAAISGARRMKQLGLATVVGRNCNALWTLTQRGLDWCSGIITIAVRSWHTTIMPTETEAEKQKRLERLVASANDAFAACSMLSQRHHNLLTLITKGFSRSEIAEHLGINVKSIDGYLKRLFAAIGCTRMIEAAVIGSMACLA